ncbi:hypothetical protein KDM87_15250 [Undibacterium sp. FT147W]|uniref:Uncharacterized protein n=1 Tax=Undibacterium rivi TaxID=2828729 RepID=A0ABS5H620_9BURK|nr:hypothetical protein [Undibacterium rivi]MBR7793948.1 hypothetical protein [Undibacterium rivi]
MKHQLRSVTNLASSAKNETAEVPSTRWWESYLVRYFIGFIVGCTCIVVFGLQTGTFDRLINHLSTTNASNGKPDWSAITALVAILGLGFCYIASTPITVLHAGRYRKGWLDGHSRHFWFAWISLCIIVLAFGGIKIIGNRPTCEWLAVAFSCVLMFATLIKNDNPIEKTHPRLVFPLFTFIWLLFFWGAVGRIFGYLGQGLSESAQRWWILSMPAFWILVGQYTVLYRLLHEKEAFFSFYAKLFKARRMKNARDVRDTYTHLREHSNSVFIVVIELALLALFMAISSSISSNKGKIIPNESLGALVVFGLVVWMVPTVFMWARANSLEVEFSDNPKSYLE